MPYKKAFDTVMEKNNEQQTRIDYSGDFLAVYCGIFEKRGWQRPHY